MNTDQCRVFIVDDDPAVRKSLGRLLRAHGIAFSAFASDTEFLDGYDPAVPGCLLLDLSLGEASGLDLQALLATREYAPPVVFMSGRASVADGIAGMKAGALDFLLKPVEKGELLRAIHQAFERDRTRRARLAERSRIRARINKLTPREQDVLRFVLEGRLNKQTAAELGITERTIKVHRSRVMEKLGARTIVELLQLMARAEQADAQHR